MGKCHFCDSGFTQKAIQHLQICDREIEICQQCYSIINKANPGSIVLVDDNLEAESPISRNDSVVQVNESMMHTPIPQEAPTIQPSTTEESTLSKGEKRGGIIGFLIVLVVLGAILTLVITVGKQSTTSVSSYSSYRTSPNKTGSTSSSSSSSRSSSSSSSTTTKAKTANDMALDKAKEYLRYMSFSKQGLINQLEYEGFTSAQAKYGVDNCGADWNAQAAAKAKEYLKYMSFSKQGLIDQLEYEGFTSAQAKYGVEHCGMDW